ncbi:MAG: alpha-2-macroglobulin, partial [Burkholderiales bacterium]|nr:alpha-2-macroglobulin [Burkholderiales bacterium]
MRLATGVLLGVLAAGATAATVERFTPQGEVRAVRQVVARFSEDMVRFGDARAGAPFSAECAEPGQGRWTDARTWVFDFSRDLPPGTRCTFTVKSEAKALAGAAVGGRTRFAFSTGGPAVLSSQPYAGAVIDEEQTFILRLNGAVHAPSVEANAWCAAEGIGERIPVGVVAGAERAALFKALRRERDAADERLLLVACRQRLPAGANVTLVWGRGIASAAADPARRVTTGSDAPLRFRVRPEFRVSLTCARENATAPCSPYLPLELSFSAPVPRALADAIRLRSAAGEARPVQRREDGDAALERVSFAPPFPENAELTVTLPSAFADDTGRTPANAAAFPLRTRTGEGAPLAKFAAGFGIVERAQPVLPVTLRNVEPQLAQARLSIGAGTAADAAPAPPAPAASGPGLKRLHVTEDTQIIDWLARLRRAGSDEFKSRETPLLAGAKNLATGTLPAPGGGKAFEVVGIPLPAPGFHVVELESARLGAALLGKPRPMYVRAGALVTNLAVHLKLGRADGDAGGSAVWVTTLDTGLPVGDAAIRISDCAGNPVWTGRTDARGVARVRATLARETRCGDDGLGAYFVSARKGDDLSFALSDWQNGIEPWRFNVATGFGSEAEVAAHTVFDRALYRAGETVSMKHVVRAETVAGLGPLAAAALPDRVRITHEGSGTEIELPVRFAARGSAAQSWKIPADAKLGVYSVALLAGGKGDGAGARRLATGSFRVAEFRLPVMQGAVTPPPAPQVRATEVPLQLALSYLSGGPASGQPVRLTALVREKAVTFAGYEEYSFGLADLRSEGDAAGADESAAAAGAGRLVLDKEEIRLGPDGTARRTIKALPRLAQPGELVAEMTYRDPSGEEHTLRGVAALWPAALAVGIHSEGWVQVRRTARLKVVTLDLAGKPRAGAPVRIQATLRTTLSSRKRTVGGFYAYDNRVEEKDLGTLCSGRSDARGLFLCEAALAQPGNVVLTATADDDAGNSARAAGALWVAGGDAWFGGDNADRMDVLPEKRDYQPGETARFQVRMPFRQATAWVAVEREGVIDTLVVPLSGKDPVVSVPIQPSWGPNVFVSVLAVRGRVRHVPWYSFLQWGWRAPRDWWRERADWVALYNKGEPTALVDLARPAFKLGIAEVQVGRAAYELKVAVAADKAVYQTRDTARVTVSVRGPDGRPPPAGTEVALAAVDEALVELMPNDSWNILEAMVRRRGYAVDTATAQMQVIGRRHFGRKALAAGGGGGRAPTRELFDTLLLWQPALALDARGEARVEVPLNDALTTFRIVAVADTPAAGGAARFGSGSTTVRATKDLQLIAGLPPLVRDGDSFRAGVTLRNTTARAMRVAVSARVAGLAATLPTQEVPLPAGAAREVFWPVTVPAGVAQLAWTVSAAEQGATKPAQDALQALQRVARAVPLTVQQATLVQLDRPLSLAVAAPADALADAGVARGGLRIGVAPSLAAAQDGVRRYFEDYPFSCLEQKASKAIGLRDKAQWQAVSASLGNHLDSDGLAAYFPGGRGSDTLTAYLLAISHEAGYPLPDHLRERMEGALIAFAEGRLERAAWAPRRDLEARKLAAIEALARGGKAVPKLLESITPAPAAWPTHAVLDWLGILARLPGVPRRDEHIAAAEQVLRARLSMQGTRLVFSTESEDHWWWLMAGGDVNAARLLALAADRPGWREDLPRLASGLVGRQVRGAWQTTTANLWGSLALERFAARFEGERVAGTTRAALDEPAGAAAPRALAWAGQPQGGVLTLPWPRGAGTLRAAHEGSGRPWLTIQSLAAVPLAAPAFAGYRIARTVRFVEQKAAGSASRGDILRVRLDIDAGADMTWVVVADPIPAGATILGAGLARDSVSAAPGERRDAGAAVPAYEERSFEAFRAYYEFAPRGRWSVEYTVRLNQDGLFALPPTRVEAMYAPEMFGALPNAPLRV